MELNHQKLIIKQKLEKLEAFTGIETKNKYQILLETGEEILFAYEESNTFARLILKRKRKLTINIIDNNKTNFLKIEKKFAFFMPEFEIFDSQNQPLGKIKTKFGLNSKIEIYNNNNELIFYCENELLHPWTFKIFKTKKSTKQLGLISKKWSGVGKEMFTDADNFKIDFDQITDETDKQRILSLSLIIDLFVFEK